MTHSDDAAVARLDDYLRGNDEAHEVDDYETDLFERAFADSAPELGFLESLGAAFRGLDARGALELWLTAGDVDDLRARGVRVLLHDFDPAHPTMPRPQADTELVVTRVPLPLDGVRRLDAEILSLDGRLLKRMPDIAFDPKDGAVHAACDVELARTASAFRTITHVYATDERGRRLLLELL